MEKFHYKLTVTNVDDDGDETTSKHEVILPKFDNIPFGIIRKNRSLPQHEQFFALLEEVVRPEDLKVIDKTPQKAMTDLMEAWQKDSGVGLGESSDS